MAYNKISWNPKYQVINNLDYEITQFLQKDGFKPDDLVILWVGANDYLAYGWNTEQDAKRVRDVISDCGQPHGAPMGAKQILLFNLPDLGQNPRPAARRWWRRPAMFPRLSQPAAAEPGTPAGPTGMVKLFEIDKQFAEMLREPQNFGLSDTENACYGGAMCGSRLSRSATTDSRLCPFNPEERLAIAGNPAAGSGRRQPAWRAAAPAS